ncbi:isoprenylcysteine carboxyl methyltransferase [Reticulibacter mediterranei]|uniref:Isoprenylcysteine carboxyl methyltransferase n=1 Tax=Reticulibacter mediterranei TaxID=2778369 RepID=A0A8J3I9D0_9CHLR|nr:isoprenylcysteine carboxylmethyltransferase family protein [Reticulibacter mediterranei]GHO91289.1 isoprenylcysteine carboxyl methyltransferase [Reticulibacter mediterranei]
MSPFFAQNLLFRNVLLAGYVIWAVMEVILGIRQLVLLHAGIQIQDKGSRLVITGTVGLGILLCWYLPRTVPATAITSASVFVFWSGITLIYAGLAFRLYAIIVLGRYFTPSVTVAAHQQVVENGPYKLIRHPAYTGLLIMFLGFGLSSTNWLSLLALMGCALLGLGYRIHVEERVLQEHLGQRYKEYMRHTKRLIPFVL